MVDEDSLVAYCTNRDPFFDIGRLDNLSALKSYILRQLGSPTICIELSDEQIVDIIGDSIRYFWKYYFYGHREDYLAFTLVPGMTRYKICQELEEIVDLSVPSRMGIPEEFLQVQTPDRAKIHYGAEFSSSCSASYGNMLGTWTAALTWTEEAKRLFETKYQVKYIRESHEVSIWPTPKRAERCLLRVYKREHFINIIQDPLFRELVVAKAGWLWTIALRKYNLTLSGGGTLNGDSLAADFKDTITTIKERIDLETPAAEIVVG